MARNVTVLDRTPNQLPADLEAKIVPLEEGQVVRIKLRQERFHKVKMQSGTTADMNVPKTSSTISKAGSVGIASHWDVSWNGQRIPCGFFSGYDASENPIFKPLKFNFGQDVFLYGSKEEDRTIYKLLQVHPQYKNRVSGPQPKFWACELDIAEAASSSEIEKFMAKNKVDNRLANLNQDDLNILMSPARYGRAFIGRADAIDNSTIARGILLTKNKEANGSATLAKLFDKMDEVKEISVLHDIFTNQKLTLVGKDLFDEKGGKVHSFGESFKGDNAEEQAIWLFDKGGKIPAVKEAIEAIKAQKKK